MRNATPFRPLSFSLARLTSSIAIAAALGMSSTSARAQVLTWDPVNDGDGLIGGSGIWDIATPLWDPTGTDSAAGDNVVWPNANTAIARFAGESGVVTINTGSGVIANELTFATSGYTVGSQVAADVLQMAGATPAITVSAADGYARINSIISGSAGLTTAGPGALFLTAANTFTGGLTVGAGSYVGISHANALGAAGQLVTVQSGGTLNFGGQLVNNNPAPGSPGRELRIAGTGVNGIGALINTTNGGNNTLAQVVLTADATINAGGTNPSSYALGGNLITSAGGRIDIRTNAAPTAGQNHLDLNGHTLTKTGGNFLALVNADVSHGSIVINDGILAFEANSILTGAADGSNGTVTVNQGGVLSFWGIANNGVNITRPIRVNGGTVGDAQVSSAAQTVPAPITIIGANNPNFTATSTNILTLSGLISKDAGSTATALEKRGGTVLTFNNPGNSFDVPVKIFQGTLRGDFTTALPAGGVPPGDGALTTTDTPLGTNSTINLSGGTLSLRIDMANNNTQQRWNLDRAIVVDHAPGAMAFDRLSNTAQTDKHVVINSLTFAPASASNNYSIGQNQLTFSQANTHRLEVPAMTMNSDTVLTNGDFTITGDVTSANRSSLVHSGGSTIQFIAPGNRDFNAYFHLGGSVRVGSGFGTPLTSTTATVGEGQIYVAPGATATFRAPGNIAAGNTIEVVSQQVALGTANFEQFTAVPEAFRAVRSGNLGIGNAAAFGDINLERLGDGTFRIGAGFAGSGGGTITGVITPGAGGVVRMGAGNTVTVSGVNRITGGASLEVGAPLVNGGFPTSGNGTVLLNQTNDYTGGTTVNRSSTLRFQTEGSLGSGPVTLFGVAQAESAGAAGPHGTFIGSGPVTIGGGSTIRFQNDAINSAATETPDRWDDATPVNLVASAIEMRSRNIGASVTNETVGATTVTGGSFINLQRLQAVTDHVSQLTLSSLTRVTQGTIEMNRNTGTGAGYGGGQRLIVADGAPTPSNGMVAPWIVALNNGPIEFMTYGANGFTPLTAYDNAVTTGTYTAAALNYDSAANTGGKVNVTTAALTLTDNPNIYALRTDQNINSSGGNNTITLHSNADGSGPGGNSGGGIIANNSTGTITIQPNVVFNNSAAPTAAPKEGIIFTRSGGTLAITGTVTADGLTKFGAGTLNLTANNAATLSGNVAVNQGVLQLFGPTTAGNHSPAGVGTILLQGGQLNLRSNATTPVAFTLQNNGIKIPENIPLGIVDLNRGDAASTNLVVTLNPAAAGGTGLVLSGSPGAQGQTFTLNGGNGYSLLVGSNGLNSFDGNVTINNAIAMTLNQNPTISGTNPVITKSGAGTLIVGPAGGTRTVSNGTTVVVNDGTLEVRSIIAFGTGDTTSFTLNRGTLFFRRDSAGNYGTLGSGTRYPVTVNGNSNIQFDRVGGSATGFVIGMGNLTVNNDSTVNFNHGNGVVLGVPATNLAGTGFLGGNLSVTSQESGAQLQGNVTGGALVKVGANILHVMGANNTYSGGTHVQSGVLRARSAGALGTGPVYLNPGATIDFNAADNLASGQALIIRSNGSHLPMVSVNVNGLAHPTANVDTSNAPVGIVGISNGTGGSYDNVVDLGALYGGRWSFGGVPQGAYDPVYTGPSIVAGADNLYRLGGGGTSFAMGTDSARVARTNVLTGANNVRLGFDSGNILPVNGGNFQFSIAGTNDYSGGSTTIHRGMVARLFSNNEGVRSGLSNSAVDVFGVLSLSGAASLDNGAANVNAVTLHPGSALFLDNQNAAANSAGAFASADNTNRFNDTTPIALNGAMINLIGRTDVASSEVIGNVTFESGARLRAARGGTTTGTATLTLNNLTRDGAGSTLMLQTSAANTLGGVDQIIVNTPPAVTNGMVSPSIVNATDHTFVTHGATGFANVAYDNVVTTPVPAGLAENAKVDISHTGAVVLSDNPTVYALRTNRDINLAGPFNQLTLRGGGLIAHANTVTINPSLVFNNGVTNIEGVIYNSSTANINGAITADGITKFGTGALIINVPQANYSSGWTVNSGSLQINDPGGLGQSVPSNAVTLNAALTTGGHASQAFGLTTLNFNRDSGTPELVTFTGGPITVVNEANIRIGGANDRNLQIPEVILDSTSTASRVSLTVDVPFSRVRGIIPTLTLNDDAIVRVTDAGATTDTGRVVAAVVNSLVGVNKELTKVGNRTLELPNDNSATFTGGAITVSQGTVRVRHSGALGSASTAVTVERNASLELDVANFNPAASVTQLPGSNERWNREDVRASGYSLPSGVNLQLNTNLNAARTIGINGGTVEGFVYTDDVAVAVERTIGSAVTLNLLADSLVGQNILQGQGYDTGRQPTTGQPFGDNVAGAYLRIDGNITGAFNLTKTGLDTVVIAGAENTYANTLVDMGTLRTGRENTLPAAGVLTTRLGGSLDLFGHNQTVSGLGTQNNQPDPGGVSVGASGRITNSAPTDNVLRVNASANFTYNGALERNVALTKAGAGSLTLAGENTHVGDTVIEGGSLIITGSISHTRNINVQSGATLDVSLAPGGFTLGGAQTLMGNGTVEGPLAISGTLAPGESVGTLTANGPVTFNPGSTFSLEINGPNSFDKLIANGVTLDGPVNLTISLNYVPSLDAPTTYLVLENTSATPVNGLFTWNGPEGELSEGESFMIGSTPFEITYQGGAGGNDVVVTAVPEPGSLVTLLAGTGMLMGLQRFRRRR